MRLPRIMDKALLTAMIIISSVFLVFCLAKSNHNTYADNESGVYEEKAEYFVNFYDEGERLIVKTNAETVGEAIVRAGLRIGETDIVDPSLDTKIDADNFYVNIHRSRPVVVVDGAFSKYVMTASYDPKTIAREAGFTIYDGDEVSFEASHDFLETGVATVYNVTRNGGRTITVEEEIPYGEETVKDYNLAPGEKEVRQLGEVGMRELTYEVFYENNIEVKRDLISDIVKREPVTKIVAVGASEIERTPLTPVRGVNIYTVKVNGNIIERKETFYDLPMQGVMNIAARECGAEAYYTVREDGVKVDAEGYVLVAAELSRYPRCSVVETSLGLGKVYDTGTFAQTNPEQFDLATDWTNKNGN